MVNRSFRCGLSVPSSPRVISARGRSSCSTVAGVSPYSFKVLGAPQALLLDQTDCAPRSSCMDAAGVTGDSRTCHVRYFIRIAEHLLCSKYMAAHCSHETVLTALSRILYATLKDCFVDGARERTSRTCCSKSHYCAAYMYLRSHHLTARV